MKSLYILISILIFFTGCYPERHITFINKMGSPVEFVIPEHLEVSYNGTTYELAAKGKDSKVDMFCGNGSWSEAEADSIGVIISGIELHSHDTSGFRSITFKRKGLGKTKLQVKIW